MFSSLRLESQTALLWLPTILGLSVALGGPVVLLSLSQRLLGDPQRFRTKVLEQLFLWLLAALVLAISMAWEKQPLASIGFRWQWISAVWGLALAGILIFGMSPVLIWLLGRLQIAGFEAGLSKLSQLPVWFLVFAVVTGGIVEEILYRGYAITRLSTLVGYGWAGVVTLTVFALSHLPLWGWGAVLTFFISGGLFTVFYLLSHDLLACMIAHVIVDYVGLIVTPRIALAKSEVEKSKA